MKNIIRGILLEEYLKHKKYEYQVRDIDGPVYYKRIKGDKWSFTDEVDFYKNCDKSNIVKWFKK